jgi:hypothetical protein
MQREAKARIAVILTVILGGLFGPYEGIQIVHFFTQAYVLLATGGAIAVTWSYRFAERFSREVTEIDQEEA